MMRRLISWALGELHWLPQDVVRVIVQYLSNEDLLPVFLMTAQLPAWQRILPVEFSDQSPF